MGAIQIQRKSVYRVAVHFYDNDVFIDRLAMVFADNEQEAEKIGIQSLKERGLMPKHKKEYQSFVDIEFGDVVAGA